MKSMAEHGETFIIYNDAYPDEYYMLENRQKTGWDAFYPAKGLMITHVDFDKNIWCWNCPNTKITSNSEEHTKYGYPVNDHQRLTIVHADNDDDSKYWVSSEGYYTKDTESTDLYPYGNLDSLTSTSKPAAKLYNKNSKGKKTVDWSILNIKQNSNGTMSFTYRATNPNVQSGNELFYESFDQCDGTGGNDDLWNGQGTAAAAFNPDNDGWIADSKAGANQCAKFGSGKKVGTVTTPTISLTNQAVLTFKAAPWSGDATSLKLSATGATVTFDQTELTMTDGEWKTFTVNMTGSGDAKIVFTPGKRFFLDEVLVVDPNATAINTINTNKVTTTRIYTLDGRYVGTDPNQLPRGLYVVNGKKIVK